MLVNFCLIKMGRTDMTVGIKPCAPGLQRERRRRALEKIRKINKAEENSKRINMAAGCETWDGGSLRTSCLCVPLIAYLPRVRVCGYAFSPTPLPLPLALLSWPSSPVPEASIPATALSHDSSLRHRFCFVFILMWPLGWDHYYHPHPYHPPFFL